MSTENIFVEGIRWFEPRPGAPEFVKGAISIEPMKLLEWLKANKQYVNDKGYLPVDVKVSREGKTYFAVNTYKPRVEAPAPPPAPPAVAYPPPNGPTAFDDSPFQ